MGRLAGKVAVITGAGSGMGRASALLFAREGAKVVCADVSGNEKQTAAAIGDAAIAVNTDVSQLADVRRAIDTATSEFGQLDIMFNNAGVMGALVPFVDVPDEDMERLFAVNLLGVFYGIKYAIPALRAAGGGSIISTASVMGLVGRRDQGAYGATKGGVVAMTKNAAIDHAEDNIRINCICPGMVYTGMAGADSDADPTVAPDNPMPVPMRRWGVPQDIANAALFLASDESSFITGVALPVDGGYTAE